MFSHFVTAMGKLARIILVTLSVVSFLTLQINCQKDDENDDGGIIETAFAKLVNFTLGIEKTISSVTDVIEPSISVYEQVAFHLYSRNNRNNPEIMDFLHNDSWTYSEFDSSRLTKVITHGWMSDGNVSWIRDIVNNYLDVVDCNIIVIDWGSGAHKTYLSAQHVVPDVGKYLSQLLNYLHLTSNLDFQDLHLLGHSLGAHVMGIAAQLLYEKPFRISGFDPAGFIFEDPKEKAAEYRLDISAAQFVDVIHTSAGVIGYKEPLGHVDFYPNGGTTPQPGCFSFTCSHGRAARYFAESILRNQSSNFIGVKCESYEKFEEKKCGEEPETAVMGEYVSLQSRGVFYLKTHSKSPYGNPPNNSST